MQRKAYSLLAVAISAALTGQVMADTPEKSHYSPEVEPLVSYDTSIKNKTKLEQRPNYFIVQLEAAPLAKAASASAVAQGVKGNRLDMSSTAVAKQSAVLAAEPRVLHRL